MMPATKTTTTSAAASCRAASGTKLWSLMLVVLIKSAFPLSGYKTVRFTCESEMEPLFDGDFCITGREVNDSITAKSVDLVLLPNAWISAPKGKVALGRNLTVAGVHGLTLQNFTVDRAGSTDNPALTVGGWKQSLAKVSGKNTYTIKCTYVNGCRYPVVYLRYGTGTALRKPLDIVNNFNGYLWVLAGSCVGTTSLDCAKPGECPCQPATSLVEDTSERNELVMPKMTRTSYAPRCHGVYPICVI
jgi:hypothetical protein